MTARRRALWCVALLLLAVPGRAGAEGYVGELLRIARKERLWEREEWRALLHYKRRLFLPGVKSSVDAEPFFLARDGKLNPQGELEATVSSFSAEDDPLDESQRPQCAFPARYSWLKEELSFDPQRLPERPCPRLSAWMAALDPKQVTLVFPVSYLNNPGSMFGHTLLRIDPPAEDQRTRLLASTVGFAADARQARGPIFAFKGLTGGYPGKFSISPYHSKVKEYGDIQNRDIWEYRLELNEGEVRRILLHVWELRSAYFDYFFLDENCSYQLLGLLDVARPDLHLTDRFPLWVIPADTVRAIAEVPGLVGSVEFRPSRRTVIQERARTLDVPLQQLALRLGEGKIGPEADELEALSALQKARVLELAADYSAYRRAVEPHASEGEDPHWLGLLQARSRLEVPPQTPYVERPSVRPDTGHKSRRLSVGYGDEGLSGFVQVEFRPAYHDLLDPPGGYVDGGQLEFLQMAARYELSGDLDLERLELLNIVSAAPADRFIRFVSWEARAGLERERFAEGERGLTGQVGGGVGLSREPLPGTLVAVFAEAETVISKRFPEWMVPALGSTFRLIHQGSERWRLGLSASAAHFLWSVPHPSYEVSLRQRLHISPQVELRLDLSHCRQFDGPFNRVLLGSLLYF